MSSAREFRPERWLGAAAPSPGAHNAKAFVPFGVGPRYCPGRQLAIVEIKTAMAMLCSTFDISKREQAQPVGEIFSFTMAPENLFVRFNGRQTA